MIHICVYVYFLYIIHNIFRFVCVYIHIYTYIQHLSLVIHTYIYIYNILYACGYTSLAYFQITYQSAFYKHDSYIEKINEGENVNRKNYI